MTFSSLTSRTVWSPKYDSRQGNKIEYLIVHSTMGGNDESNVVYLATNPVQVSANYVLQTTGRLVGLVPEEYRAWTTGWYADKNGVTVETVNTVNRDPWPISREQGEKIAQLLADLCRRYGWGKIDASRIRFHYQFMNTACPGPYVKGLRQDFINRANEILGAKPAPAPKPGKLAEDGGLGPATIRRWQEEFGTVADGVISEGYSPFVAALQRFLNGKGARDWDGKKLVVDGVGIGSNIGARYPSTGRTRTVWALQHYVGGFKDGVLDEYDFDGGSSDAVRRVQVRLNRGKGAF